MPFRAPHMDLSFFIFFGALFVLYALATWIVLRAAPMGRSALPLLFGFAIVFNAALLPSIPNLSDDMYRYIWDGRVQASGFNPYRYASDAPELILLRDAEIWARMNRRGATTIYPPGAQLVFAIGWRLVGDSILAFKILFVCASFICAALLVQLLKRLGQAPERVILFLWGPLLIFEIAHSGHVDALYLPLIVAALLVRAASPADRVEWRYEGALGILIGLAILVKLYPAILVPPLWALRDSQGKRRWRLAFPLTTLLVTGLGYLLYIAPGVNTLGFLARYTQEFFNIGPLPLALNHWSEGN
ncbi:MAG TPA: glycosyltransferase 87 family protein, partial [Aggregatilineales bacterium]|nr:glycosyltransferase 87 family protein [Aggregatilineales bacterium]